jgi:hypothetical protein
LRAAATARLVVVAFLLAACSRSPGTEASPDAAPQRSQASLPSAPSSPALPAPTPNASSEGPVLTPEDAEEDAAHRITERNLESELDRLEREIQAE